MELAVVDASVALKWVFPDEEDGPAAAQLLMAFHSGQVRLAVPSLWEYEIANALKSGVARNRLTHEEGREALHFLLELGVHLYGFGPFAARAWELAVEHGVSIYDAAYLALAEQSDCRLYTGDQRLVRAASHVDLVRWIGAFT